VSDKILTKEQTSIPKGKIGRAASLAGAGVKIGANYLRYNARKWVTGNDDLEDLHRSNAADTYHALSRLKGGPLKIAQMLSIDTAMLPGPYAEQFSQAHYQAPPLSYPLVERTFRRETGKSPLEIFDTFGRSAICGASIGQVHKATKDGKNFAVKVQYPGVADSLKNDLRLVRPVAMRLFDLRAGEIDPYMKEVEERLIEETDYELELERGESIARKTRGKVDVGFPSYHRAFSSSRILTMDWLDGLPLDQFVRQEPDQSLRNRIGQRLWDFYHFQIHELREFHADPHPGNFLVEGEDLRILDFGCVKVIPSDFHAAYFTLLRPEVARDPVKLETALRRLDLILEQDSEHDRRILLDLFRESVDLLSRPFAGESFDFGDPSYLQAVRDFGERTGNDPELKRVGTGRGSAHGLYVNRTYFGLYSLMGTLGALIRTELPRVDSIDLPTPQEAAPRRESGTTHSPALALYPNFRR